MLVQGGVAPPEAKARRRRRRRQKSPPQAPPEAKARRRRKIFGIFKWFQHRGRHAGSGQVYSYTLGAGQQGERGSAQPAGADCAAVAINSRWDCRSTTLDLKSRWESGSAIYIWRLSHGRRWRRPGATWRMPLGISGGVGVIVVARHTVVPRWRGRWRRRAAATTWKMSMRHEPKVGHVNGSQLH